jgi:hypothetical protein
MAHRKWEYLSRVPQLHFCPTYEILQQCLTHFNYIFSTLVCDVNLRHYLLMIALEFNFCLWLST